MTVYDTFETGIGVTVLEADRGTVEDVREDSPIAINGIAIPENTVLRGGQGVEHFYPPAMAERAAEVLQEQIEADDATVHLVKNFHDTEGQAPADDIIGEVTGAGYEQGVGVRFVAETTDMDTAQKIANGYLEVSPSIARELGSLDETMQAREVTDVAGFRDIAVVGRGQPGVDVEVGSNPAVEALSRVVLDVAERDDGGGDGGGEGGGSAVNVDLEAAKQRVGAEYDIDPSELDDRLAGDDEAGGDGGGEPSSDDDRVVTLIEADE